MKTNEVKACVTQQLRRLQVLPEPQRRAELAELRRGVGRQPGDLPALWGALLADMPDLFCLPLNSETHGREYSYFS